MRINYKAYAHNASGLADEIVSKHADDLSSTINEALCNFAEIAIAEERERIATILDRGGWVAAARAIRMMSASQ